MKTTFKLFTIKTSGPSFLNGHGDAQTVTGQNYEVLLDETVNKEFVTDTIIYARSCDSGKNIRKYAYTAWCFGVYRIYKEVYRRNYAIENNEAS